MHLEATKEAMSSARHYGAMRFGIMAAFFIMSGLFVNAINAQHGFFKPEDVATMGAVSALWFIVFEFLLSYNLTKLWVKIAVEADDCIKGAWPQRNQLLVWAGRLMLPLPYLGALGLWLAKHPTLVFYPSPFLLVLGAWVVMAIGWLAAEKGRW